MLLLTTALSRKLTNLSSYPGSISSNNYTCLVIIMVNRGLLRAFYFAARASKKNCSESLRSMARSSLGPQQLEKKLPRSSAKMPHHCTSLSQLYSDICKAHYIQTKRLVDILTKIHYAKICKCEGYE